MVTKSSLILGTDTQDNFLQHSAIKAWLGQFVPSDQPDVVEMLSAIRLVSRDAFVHDLKTLIGQRINEGPGPIGLYAEREIRKQYGVPNALFKRTKTKVKRAIGVGPLPIKPTRAYDPEVGSEGLVAHLITELCRCFKRKVFNHPGPDEIRKRKIRRMFLVTDLIGTGTRAFDYLNAAWKVESVQSWYSLGLIRFEVIAYAGTDEGMQRVQSHRCKPIVSIIAPCPTIDTSFSGEQRLRIKNICIRYDPGDHDPALSLGYQGQGCLIAFAHGVPNNAPRILHKGNNKWAALFPARVTADLAKTFRSGTTPSMVAQRLRAMRQHRLAKVPWLNEGCPARQRMMLVLAALSSKLRSDSVIAMRTGLTLLDVRDVLLDAQNAGWINQELRLTDLGHGQLNFAKKAKKGGAMKGNRWWELPNDNKPDYYPKSLRAPTT